MLSSNVEIRSSDGHSILDQKTGERLNPAKNVTIGDHVWLGAGVKVMKGARLGSRSVVAAAAIVTGDVPEGSIVVGIPARVLRNGVTWDRRRLAVVADSH
jgi:acetyltransferase-like isoleucine patch superfamily enzyme